MVVLSTKRRRHMDYSYILRLPDDSSISIDKVGGVANAK